ncbi:MAG: phage holin family protein [Actinomycetota bacterium]|nr:phage holin family protein [Actinomycetota bacterium]
MTDYQGQSEARDQPVGELLKQLSDQTATLVRQEMELARTELVEKGKQAGIGAGAFGGASLVGIFGLQALTATLILALATAMDAWLAALIVTIVYLLIAGVLALVGKSKVQQATPPLPERMKASVQDDVQEVKTRVQSGRQ